MPPPSAGAAAPLPPLLNLLNGNAMPSPSGTGRVFFFFLFFFFFSTLFFFDFLPRPVVASEEVEEEEEAEAEAEEEEAEAEAEEEEEEEEEEVVLAGVASKAAVGGDFFVEVMSDSSVVASPIGVRATPCWWWWGGGGCGGGFARTGPWRRPAWRATRRRPGC